MHTAAINRISTDAQGRWAVTASDDKTARVWDLASGRLLQVLRPPIGPGDEGKLYAVALSPDGAVVAAAGWTGWDWYGKVHVYLFDRASGRLLQRLGGLPNVVLHLVFSPDGRHLAACLGAGQGVRVWHWRASAEPAMGSGFGADSYGASFSRDGRLVVSSYDGQLRLYRVAGSGQPVLEPLATAKAPGGQRPYAVDFHPDGSRIALGYDDSTRVDVVDGRTLAALHAPSVAGVANGNLSSVAWSADGQVLAAAGAWNVAGRYPVRLWPEAGRGAPRDVPTLAGTVMSQAARPQGGWLVAGYGPAWGSVTAQGQWQPQGTAPVADLRDSLRSAFLLAAGGRQVQFGFEPGGQPAHVFDLRNRRLAAGRLADGQPADSRSLDIQGWEDNTQVTLRGKALTLDTYEKARSLAIAPGAGRFVLGADWWLRLFGADGAQRWRQAVPGVVWGVNIPASGAQAGKLVVAAYGDGTLRWHRLSDGQELLAFFPHADRQRWVLWTPQGYYDASPGAEDLIGWHVNRGVDQAADFFPVSRFREKFYRPDIIDRVLDTLDEAQAVAQADAARGARPTAPATPQALAQALPPVVELLSGSDVRTSQPQLTLRVRGRSATDAPVTAWRLRLNGQAVNNARGLRRADSEAATADQTLTLDLPPQDSEIQVFAENRHGVSTPATVRVRWTGAPPAAPPQAAGFQIQPKLYVLAVGVAQYQHAQIAKLGLPAKDARDFAAALQRQKGRLYREVEVRLLTDGQATRDDIVDGLDWLQKNVTQHDIGMVFIAGHGTNDPTLGYTYLPVNADPDKLRRTGVAMDEFRKTLASLPGKALFFFDTCHSGNVLGGRTRAGPNDVSGVINELSSAENGVVVFSSSTGRQLSYEDAAWGNGAFTKALVEGLDGRADYQKNGRITHKMLDLYVSERVKALTGGKQSPVTQAPGGVPDFPVALVR